MVYKAPDKPREEWTDEELNAHVEYLEKQQKLRRIAELEEEEKKSTKIETKQEDSEDEKPVVNENKKLEDEAFEIFIKNQDKNSK